MYPEKSVLYQSVIMHSYNVAAVTIKRKITTKYRLPVLNWVSMKPNQVKGTIFSDLDDEKLYSVRPCTRADFWT